MGACLPSASPKHPASPEAPTPPDTSPDVNELLNLIPLPRFSFHYPELVLASCSSTAEVFLPLTRPAGTRASDMPPDSSLPTLRFDQCFRSAEAPNQLTSKEWVDSLVSECAQGNFGRHITLRPYDYPHASTATLFFASTRHEGVKALHVLLLSPVNSPAAVVQGPNSKATATGERNPAALDGDGDGDGDSPMTAEQLDYILMRSAKGTLDPTKGRKALSAEDLRSLFDYLPGCAFVTNLDGHVDYFNKAWYDYTGFDHVDSTDPHSYRRLFHEDDLPGVLAAWQHSLLTHEDFNFPYRIRSAQGELRWHNGCARPARDSKGNVIYWVTLLHDVEELIQTRSEAVAAKNHMRAVLNASRSVIFSISEDLCVTFFEGFGRAQKLRPVVSDGSTIGRELVTVWPDSALQDAMRQMIAAGQHSSTLRSKVLLDGSPRWYRYNLTALFAPTTEDQNSPRVHGISAIGTDVTEMVDAEHELTRATLEHAELLARETAALEASRLKTEYFTHISHETRTPLAGIMAIAEVLLSDSTLSDPHRNLVRQLLRSGEILLEMIGMVLDMRKLEVGQLKLERTTFHTADLIADAKLLAVLAKRKGLDYIEDIGSYHPGPLRGDRGRLRQVIANGLSNAAKFTDTGSVTLRVQQTAETAASIRLRFDIIDTGCGISPSVLSTLFRPFQQADLSTARRHGGAGLGLAISRELISLMGGTVNLQSVEGQGTTMTVEIELEKDLSRASGEAADPDVAAREPVSDSSGRHNSNLEANASTRKPESVRILLAEDNKLVRDLYVRILRQRGFSIVAVADGQQAVDAVHSEGQFDLIFMDGQMPVKDGYQAAGEIRASTSPTIAHIKIVALTASAFEGDRDRCLAAGMDDYLSKPVKADTLEQMVWQHVK